MVESGFQMPFEKPISKLLLQPITTGANSAMDKSEFQVISSNFQEKSRVLAEIGFGLLLIG